MTDDFDHPRRVNGVPIVGETEVERLVPRHEQPSFGKASPSYFDKPASAPPKAAAAHSNISPSYYERGGISFSQVVDAWQLNPWEAFIVKYVLRAKLKGAPLEDLRKARWCLDHEIARRESEAKHEERD